MSKNGLKKFLLAVTVVFLKELLVLELIELPSHLVICYVGAFCNLLMCFVMPSNFEHVSRCTALQARVCRC